MKTTGVLSLLAAIGAVSATPTKSLSQPPTKRDNAPKVKVSGNGELSLDREA